MAHSAIDILRNISEIIANGKNYHAVLSDIVTFLTRSLDVDVCSVYAYSESKKRLTLTATHGLEKESVGQVSLRPGEGLTGECFVTQRVLNLSNPELDLNFKLFEETGELLFKSFLSVPLNVAGKCVGVLVMQRRKAGVFSDSIVALTQSLSVQLAHIILNAGMMKMLAKSPEETNPASSARDQLTLRGVAANAGIAVGQALLFETADVLREIRHANAEDTEKELELLHTAIRLCKTRTIALEKRAVSMISEVDASIFYTHLLFLEDPAFLKKLLHEIKENGHTLEFSVKQVYEEYEARFNALKDKIFRERVIDLKDVVLRLLETVRVLRGEGPERCPFMSVGRNRVLVARELLPSDLIRMPLDNIAGIVTEKGGATAHLAILAKALNIPALMGVKDLMDQVRNNDRVILDSHAELFHVRPDAKVEARFREMFAPNDAFSEDAHPGTAKTADGTTITLRGNIALIAETATLRKYGARGIGLYRSEFLFMVRDFPPSADEQFNVFAKIVRGADGGPVNLRLLDVGGDKPLPYLRLPPEDNPALGNRGVRLLLKRRDFFREHLKAILRAGSCGEINILVPMVSREDEILAVKEVLAEAEAELRLDGVPFSDHCRLGLMLEIPSAIFQLENLTKHVDFVSVGSNDLYQYVFALDRTNEMVADRFQPLEPVFLGLLKQIGDWFSEHADKGLSLCGEMAGNPLAVPLLLGAGFRELSMSPRRVPMARAVAKAFTLDECRTLLNAALASRDADTVAYMVRETAREKKIEARYLT